MRDFFFFATERAGFVELGVIRCGRLEVAGTRVIWVGIDVGCFFRVLREFFFFFLEALWDERQ